MLEEQGETATNAPLVFELGKSFSKTSFQLRMYRKKGQKQGRDERTQEEFRRSAKIHSRCRVVFVRSLPCFCPFSGPSLT